MSIELQKAIQSYENFISAHGISEELINAYVQATKVALQTENARMRKRGKNVWRYQERCCVWMIINKCKNVNFTV